MKKEFEAFNVAYKALIECVHQWAAQNESLNLYEKVKEYIRKFKPNFNDDDVKVMAEKYWEKYRPYTCNYFSFDEASSFTCNITGFKAKGNNSILVSLQNQETLATYKVDLEDLELSAKIDCIYALCYFVDGEEAKIKSFLN